MYNKKSLIRAVLDIYRTSLGYISVRSASFGVGRGQWYFLNRLLMGGDGISQEQLSDELFVDSAHTARALKKLEDEGYILRKADKNDSRKKTVFVTDKAMGIRQEYHQLFKDLNGILTKGFTPEEKELAQNILYKIRNNIVEYVAEKK